MFGKTKKQRCILYDARNQRVFEGSPEDLTFPENELVALSIEYFNDPDPCYIHLGAVSNILLLRLKDFFQTPGDYEKQALPEDIQRYLGYYDFTRIQILA